MSDGVDVEVTTAENPTSEIESSKGKSALTSRRPLSTSNPIRTLSPEGNLEIALEPKPGKASDFNIYKPKPLPTMPGWLFHNTSKLDDIRGSGVEPRNEYLDGNRGPALSFWAEGRPYETMGEYVVRTRLSEAFAEGLGRSVYKTDVVIPPETLEYWGMDQQWHPLAQAPEQAPATEKVV